MSESVINDPMRLTAVFKIGGVVTDLTGEQAFFDYFIPGNATNTADGQWEASIPVGTEGVFTYDIAQNILNAVGLWRFQPSGTNDGNTYHEQNPTCHTVVDKGGSC